MQPTSWMLKGTCSSGKYDRDLWFPEGPEPGPAVRAKRICREECPVLALCAEHAVNFPVPLAGIWGGMSPREVRRVRRSRGLKVQSEATFSKLPAGA